MCVSVSYIIARVIFYRHITILKGAHFCPYLYLLQCANSISVNIKCGECSLFVLLDSKRVHLSISYICVCAYISCPTIDHLAYISVSVDSVSSLYTLSHLIELCWKYICELSSVSVYIYSSAALSMPGQCRDSVCGVCQRVEVRSRAI